MWQYIKNKVEGAFEKLYLGKLGDCLLTTKTSHHEAEKEAVMLWKYMERIPYKEQLKSYNASAWKVIIKYGWDGSLWT